MGSGSEKSAARHRSRRVWRLVAAGLFAAAVVKELRLPPEERTWHGDLAGVLPYELRRPTLARAKERLWNPDNPRLVGPRVFGVGWSVNVGRLVALARQRWATPD